MLTKSFKRLESETDEQFHERVDKFADSVTYLCVNYICDENAEAYEARVKYFD